MATAVRLANLAELTWADIDWERRLVWLNDVKARTRMSVPLSRMALDALSIQQARFGDSKYCFPSASGKHRLNKDVFRNRVWRPAMRAAGIPSTFTWHDLRHSAATHMLDAGADLYTVCDVLGHSDFRTTQRYAHVRDERRRAAVERLDRKRLPVSAWPRKIQIIDTEST